MCFMQVSKLFADLVCGLECFSSSMCSEFCGFLSAGWLSCLPVSWLVDFTAVPLESYRVGLQFSVLSVDVHMAAHVCAFAWCSLFPV